MFVSYLEMIAKIILVLVNKSNFEKFVSFEL